MRSRLEKHALPIATAIDRTHTAVIALPVTQLGELRFERGDLRIEITASLPALMPDSSTSREVTTPSGILGRIFVTTTSVVFAEVRIENVENSL